MPARNDIPDWFLKQLETREDEAEQQYHGKTLSLFTEMFGDVKSFGERNCFYCGHFNRENDTCRLAPQAGRPPTFIIVHGCAKWWHEDDIPY
jgi:hypothetical protein